MMYHIYVLKSISAKKIYVGSTANLQKRIFQHQKGFSKATSPYKDWRLVYEEIYPTRSIATKREKFLKSGDGRRVLKSKGIL